MKTYLLYSTLLLATFLSCSKENAQSKDYQQNWKLVSSSGGLHGNGFELNFDFLAINQDDKFEIIANGSILSSGTLKVSSDPNYDYKVEFQDALTVKSSAGYLDLVEDTEKYFNIRNDSLFVYAPCCDRYDSVYVKE